MEEKTEEQRQKELDDYIKSPEGQKALMEHAKRMGYGPQKEPIPNPGFMPDRLAVFAHECEVQIATQSPPRTPLPANLGALPDGMRKYQDEVNEQVASGRYLRPGVQSK